MNRWDDKFYLVLQFRLEDQSSSIRVKPVLENEYILDRRKTSKLMSYCAAALT